MFSDSSKETPGIRVSEAIESKVEEVQRKCRTGRLERITNKACYVFFSMPPFPSFRARN